VLFHFLANNGSHEHLSGLVHVGEEILIHTLHDCLGASPGYLKTHFFFYLLRRYVSFFLFSNENRNLRIFLLYMVP